MLPESILVAIILASAACGGLTEPRKVAPSLDVVLGRSATDTIGAKLDVPLTVTVHDATGKPAYQTPVTFTVLPVPGVETPALVSPTSYVYSPQTAMKEWTDRTGRAAVTVQLGPFAGQIRIAIDGNELPVHDTVTYTVLPGHAVRITTTPADSALYVGARYRLAARVLDRADNVRTDPVLFTVDSASDVATVQPDGTITGAAVGRSRLLLSLADTTVTTQARVSVVPSGTLGVTMDGYVSAIARVNLDGSRYRILTTNAAGQFSYPSWSPDGSNLVYNTTRASGSSRLMRVDTLGNAAPIQHVGTLSTEIWPRYSYDGRYIYYTAGVDPDDFDTYRINADGTGTPTLITPPRTGSMKNWRASPSPNASLVAYSEAGFAIATVSLSDGSHRELSTPSEGEAPRFSPDGTWIAFGEEPNHQLHLIHPDGTGYRTLTPATVWVAHWGHDWSPDGTWIVIRTGAGGQLAIVRVADALLIVLPYARDMYEPTWRPIP